MKILIARNQYWRKWRTNLSFFCSSHWLSTAENLWERSTTWDCKPLTASEASLSLASSLGDSANISATSDISSNFGISAVLSHLKSGVLFCSLEKHDAFQLHSRPRRIGLTKTFWFAKPHRYDDGPYGPSSTTTQHCWSLKKIKIFKCRTKLLLFEKSYEKS